MAINKLLSIEMEERVIRRVIHEPGIFGRLLDVNVEGKTVVLTRDIQMHPVTDEPMHMDMLRVSKSSTVALVCRLNSSIMKNHWSENRRCAERGPP